MRKIIGTLFVTVLFFTSCKKQQVTVIEIADPSSRVVTENLFEGDSYAKIVTAEGDTIERIIITKDMIKLTPPFKTKMETFPWGEQTLITE